MTLLVVGAAGLLGGEVCRQAVAAGRRVVGAHHRTAGALPDVAWAPLDVRDRSAVLALADRVRPTAVVNTAYRYDDWAVTADGAAHVALAAASVGARLVHVSSDAVHGGRTEPYADDEPPSPIFAYGAAKAAAETTVRLVDPGAVLVRTSLILGDEHSNQVRLCLAATTDGGPRLFVDEIRCPVGVEDLASAVLELVDSTVAGPLNVCGPEALSRVELGGLVARRHGIDPARLRTGRAADSGLPPRPAEVRLDPPRALALLRTRIRPASTYLTPPGLTPPRSA
ncbi:sugar nucleotide-binding protein [Polymorphospora rubra]|uniref:sugar nucleotide-binding protein n=1 Tax=Polymorphospora rubra TaxID=338584 RepID=UPI001BB31F4D|nr:sugar nucleotide-binding protein [Polymorphospora rubra]